MLQECGAEWYMYYLIISMDNIMQNVGLNTMLKIYCEDVLTTILRALAYTVDAQYITYYNKEYDLIQ